MGGDTEGGWKVAEWACWAVSRQQSGRAGLLADSSVAQVEWKETCLDTRATSDVIKSGSGSGASAETTAPGSRVSHSAASPHHHCV